MKAPLGFTFRVKCKKCQMPIKNEIEKNINSQLKLYKGKDEDPDPLIFGLPDPWLSSSDPFILNKISTRIKLWFIKSHFMPTYLTYKYIFFHFELGSDPDLNTKISDPHPCIEEKPFNHKYFLFLIATKDLQSACRYLSREGLFFISTSLSVMYTIFFSFNKLRLKNLPLYIFLRAYKKQKLQPKCLFQR